MVKPHCFSVVKPHCFSMVKPHCFSVVKPHCFSVVKPHCFSMAKPYCFSVVKPHCFYMGKPHCLYKGKPHCFSVVKSHCFSVVKPHSFSLVKPHCFSLVKPHCSNFRIITTIFPVSRMFGFLFDLHFKSNITNVLFFCTPPHFQLWGRAGYSRGNVMGNDLLIILQCGIGGRLMILPKKKKYTVYTVCHSVCNFWTHLQS